MERFSFREYLGRIQEYSAESEDELMLKVRVFDVFILNKCGQMRWHVHQLGGSLKADQFSMHEKLFRTPSVKEKVRSYQFWVKQLSLKKGVG